MRDGGGDGEDRRERQDEEVVGEEEDLLRPTARLGAGRRLEDVQGDGDERDEEEDEVDCRDGASVAPSVVSSRRVTEGVEESFFQRGWSAAPLSRAPSHAERGPGHLLCNSQGQGRKPDDGELSKVEPVARRGRVVDKDVRAREAVVVDMEEQADGELLGGADQVGEEVVQREAVAVALFPDPVVLREVGGRGQHAQHPGTR